MATKLLLADDSITIQKVVELVLAEEDFEIRSVSNGEDALNMINTFNPDIVLADIEMPKVNGYQLCEKIKQDPRNSGIPVILLAGAFEPIDEALAAKVGADDSVIKPFESQELISKINAALTMVSAGGIEEAAFAEPAEEALEFAEEAGAGVRSETVDLTALEEDLWSMEEISSAPEELTAETVIEEEPAGVESPFELIEEALLQEPQEEAPGLVPQMATGEEIAVQGVTLPSKEEFLRTFEKTIDEKVTSYLATLDIRDALLSSLMPSMKDSIEKILWEIAPELVEKMLKEVLKGSISSLANQVEKVIWETVPDLAGSMISKEIEKIKSEF